jgi:hypothetical protein
LDAPSEVKATTLLPAVSCREEQTAQLLAVLGDGIQEEAARKLLGQCGGDLQRAVNAFYNTSEAGRSMLGNHDKAAPKPQPSPQVTDLLLTVSCL